MTEEDYILYLNREIQNNNEKILKIENKNRKLERLIKKAKTKSKQKVLKK